MKFILLIILCSFSINLSAAGKIKFLSKYEFNKLDKIEKEYYVKKLYKIVAQFEKRMNKGNKLRASNGFVLPKIFEEAFAAERIFNSKKYCITGGRILSKKGTCKISKYVKDGICPGDENGSGKKFECGPIYGEICVDYKNNGATLSEDCRNKATTGGTFRPSFINVELFKKYVGQVCNGKENMKSDGCIILADQLEVQLEVAQEFAQNIKAELGACRVVRSRPVRSRPKSKKVCQINLKNEDGEYSSYDYEGDDLVAFISAINTTGYLNVPDDLDDIRIEELIKQFKSKKGCGNIPVPKAVRDDQALRQAKCPGFVLAPESSEGGSNSK